MNIFLLILIPSATAILIPLLDYFNNKLKNIVIPFAAFAELCLSLFIYINNYSLIKENKFIITHKTGYCPPFFTLDLAIDSLGLLFTILVSLALFLIIIYALASRESEPGEERQFYILLFLVLGMMQGIILTGDLLNLFIFFELMTVLSTPLIAIKNDQISTDAALKYLVYGLIGGIFFLLAIILIWVNLNTLNMVEVAKDFNQINFNVQVSIIIFFIIGLIIKLGIFPFHFWIPLAHSACPSSISALLSGVILEIYLYIFVRTFWYVIDFTLIQEMGFVKVIMFLGLFSSLVGHLFALQADDIKRMLAFSSIGNIGIIIGVFSLNTELGLYGGLLHIIAHLLMKSALFTGTGHLLKFTASHSIQDFRGVGYQHNGVLISCIITMLGMVGVPPLIGFMSKWYILRAFLEKNNYIGIIVVILGSMISVIYYFRYISKGYETSGDGKCSKNGIIPDGIFREKVVVFIIYVFTGLTVISGVFMNFLDLPLKAAINVLLNTDVYLKLFLGGS